MDINHAKTLTRQVLDHHGLHHWNVAHDQALRRFGQTRFRALTISLSKPLTECNSDAQVWDTILHEVAHALAGPGAGHGPEWKRIARKLGANPEAQNEGEAPPSKYIAVCGTCGQVSRRERLTQIPGACARCCRVHNYGRYTVRFAFKFVLNTEGK